MERTRGLALVLGGASALFGAAPLLAPRRTARGLGLPLTADPAAEVLVRGVGARELVAAAGLLAAARHGTGYGVWGLARAASDAGDAAASLLALRAGSASKKLRASAVSASVGVVGGLSLWWLDRRAEGPTAAPADGALGAGAAPVPSPATTGSRS
ncbi:MAG: hypothetical protein ACRCYR_00010 [Phycicoccus sp.]